MLPKNSARKKTRFFFGTVERTGRVQNVDANGFVVDGKFPVMQIFDRFFVRVEKLAVEKHVNNRRFAGATGAQ